MDLIEFSKNNEDGFTLIEILLVISILGILVTLFMPNFGKAQLNSRVTAHNANVKMLKSAGAMYLLDNPMEPRSSINISELKYYLDDDVDLTLDKVISKDIGISKFTIKVDEFGGIDVNPGEVKVQGDKITLVEKEKRNE